MTNAEINEAITRVYGWTAEFTFDLNAMHEVEKSLTAEQWEDYVEHVGGTWEEAMHATARRRAEAYLRTIGKWGEVQP